MLSVVIPAYNEAQRLPPTLTRIMHYLTAQKWEHEVLVVDDGSRDETAVVAQQAGRHVKVIRLQPNRGKGYAVRRGMLAASGQRVLFSDADLSTPIQEIEKLQAALDAGADVAVGSRAINRALVKVHQPWHREKMGNLFNVCVQQIAVKGIKDTQCGFKLFTRQAAQDIFSRSEFDGFVFDVEVVALAKLLGYQVAEVPVLWFNSQDSRVNVFSDPFKMFVDLWAIRAKIKKLARALGRKW